MRRFSERHGYEPVREALQIEDLELNTRRRIWNLLSQHFFESARGHRYDRFIDYCQVLCELLWDNFFKWTHDHLYEAGSNDVYDILRKFVLADLWYRVYDFLEATVEHAEIAFKDFLNRESLIKDFIKDCNRVLEEELCGYRIISRLVTPITSPTEILEIEEAISHPFETINQHMQTAFELFSSRTSPNYPNSVKEAISAVECICRIILADRNVTLGTALNRLEDGGVPIHRAFRNGISALYGWTSSDAGIRHARVDESEIGFDEAKMMILLCSAFVNFLKTKAEKSGIDLQANYEAIRER